MRYKPGSIGIVKRDAVSTHAILSRKTAHFSNLLCLLYATETSHHPHWGTGCFPFTKQAILPSPFGAQIRRSVQCSNSISPWLLQKITLIKSSLQHFFSPGAPHPVPVAMPAQAWANRFGSVGLGRFVGDPATITARQTTGGTMRERYIVGGEDWTGKELSL